MKKFIFLSVLAVTFIASTQCSLTERLAKVSNEISQIKENLKLGTLSAAPKCNRCRTKCRTGCRGITY